MARGRSTNSQGIKLPKTNSAGNTGKGADQKPGPVRKQEAGYILIHIRVSTNFWSGSVSDRILRWTALQVISVRLTS